MAPLNVAVLVSGRGVALRMTLSACATDPSPGSVVAVVGSIDCPALQVARDEGVPHVGFFSLADYDTRTARAQAMTKFLSAAQADFIFTAGYSDVVDSLLLEEFPDRVMSIYPSLLPAYEDEENTVGAPLDHGVKLIGVTYHLREAMSRSGGPIIAQQAIPVDVDDTVHTVEPRIAQAEASLLPGILLAFAQDRVSVEGRRVRIADRSNSAGPR